jgi:hypothetical protein
MSAKQILASVAVTGAVATIGLLNVGSIEVGQAFLSASISPAE